MKAMNTTLVWSSERLKSKFYKDLGVQVVVMYSHHYWPIKGSLYVLYCDLNILFSSPIHFHYLEILSHNPQIDIEASSTCDSSSLTFFLSCSLSWLTKDIFNFVLEIVIQNLFCVRSSISFILTLPWFLLFSLCSW